MDPFVGEIRMFPFNFAPSGWALCNGQLLPLSQNTALFSLLGTQFGGDGKSNFALPNLQGRAPMHQGQGSGLTDRLIGEQGGDATVTLLDSEIPQHTHTMAASNNDVDTNLPGGAISGAAQSPLFRPDANTTMNPRALAIAGGGLPHNNMQPYLTLSFNIALQGVYPPRS